MKATFVSSVVLIATLTSAGAAESAAPLPAGKPAGIHQAQREDGNTMLVIAGAALVGIGIALATEDNDVAQPAKTSPPSTTTSSTSTSP